MPQSLSDKLIGNTAWNFAGRAGGIAVGLLLTPYMLYRLGVDGYGVWAVAGVLAGYFNLLDFGMGSSFVRQIAALHARGDSAGIGRVVSTGAAFYAAFGAAAVLLAWFGGPAVLSLFRFPENLSSDALFVFRTGMVLFALSNFAGAFGAVQGGLQRMDVTNRISLGAALLTAAGTVFFLEAGWGLRGVALGNAAAVTLASAAHLASAYRLLPGLRASAALADAKTFRELFAFGARLQSAKLADAIVFQADRLLLAHFLGAGAAGVYQLGSSVAGHLRSLPLLLVSAVLPAAADLDARLEKEKLRTLYLKGTKYLALAGMPLFFFAAAAAGPLVSAWLGPGYDKAAMVLRVLAAGYLANLLSGAGSSVAAAIGRPGLVGKAALVSAVSNLALCAGFVLLWGFDGMPFAAALSLFAGLPYFFRRLHGEMGLSSREVFSAALLRPAASALLPALPLAALNAWLAPALAAWPRASLGGLVLLEAALFGAVYLASATRKDFLDRQDRELLRRAAGRLAPFGGRGEGAC